MHVVYFKYQLLCQYGMIHMEFLFHLSIIQLGMIYQKPYLVFKDLLNMIRVLNYLLFMLGTILNYLMLIQKQNILLENIIYHVLFMLKKLRNHKDIQLLDLMRDINLRRDYNGKKIIVVLKK